MDRQCPSCGGFCKKSGCERENNPMPGSIIYTNPPVEIRGDMTLRDYFAAKAMQVVLKDQYENDMLIGEGYVQDGMYEEICAEVSYMMADAMLKERLKGTK